MSMLGEVARRAARDRLEGWAGEGREEKGQRVCVCWLVEGPGGVMLGRTFCFGHCKKVVVWGRFLRRGDGGGMSVYNFFFLLQSLLIDNQHWRRGVPRRGRKIKYKDANLEENVNKICDKHHLF